MRFRIHAVTAALFAGLGASSVFAGATPLTTELVANGLLRPIGVVAPDGDFNRIFVLEKFGRIRVIENDVLLGTPFLDINGIVGGGTSTGDERGLLGLAFHPDYMNNGLFYINYTNNSSNTTIARYSVSGDPATSNVANPSSASVLLTISQPFSNHNGGWIAFGPNDGYLYISTGDGGSGGDPGDRSQNINQLLGKMLRIDVDSGSPYSNPPDNPFVGVNGLDEIWAYGLRNAWRNSFDPETGDLYIADVGQNAWEEINLQRGSSTGGENYGWRCMEGNHCFTGSSGCTCNSSAVVDPLHEYPHSQGCSLTGGEVYRGCNIPAMSGTYFFADYCFSTIWSFDATSGTVQNFTVRTGELDPGPGSISSIASFGRDGYGEIYIVEQGSSSNNGEVYRIIPDTSGPANDCNSNSIEDLCEVADGSVIDDNDNGIPDTCEQPALEIEATGVASQSINVDLSGNPDAPFSIRVTGDANNSDIDCVDAYVQADGTVDAGAVAQTLAEWGAQVTVSDDEIIPEASYTIATEGFSSDPAQATTLIWGDINQNTIVNLEDAQLAVVLFNTSGYDAEADVDPCGGNSVINLADIQKIVQVWQLVASYSSLCTVPCP